ncbi:CaiB/BaiF CoA transferase family protein [Amorphus sp. 3PC139-8]|uniref:CaiB/BaiF CoA transferase family protein n=1 Tax=Amorphus sp. 3PC139-8 TaxID=2735676 RepID=UPI00345D2DBC
MAAPDASAAKPLLGLRILTIEQFGAGPYGTLYLADLGAEVIKVEHGEAGGDAARHGGPYLLGDNDSLYFQGWHTNKKSVTLDLKSEDGQMAFRKLVRDADAVVNNLRGDQAAKLGLEYAALKDVNPCVVCGHISAYGRDNERAGRPGYDFLMQAEAGLMSMTGDPDGDPARFGPSIIDFMTGMTLTVGLLSAVLRARETGVGGDVDTSLFEVALHQLNYSATWYLNTGFKATRQKRSSHLSATPSQTYRAKDGWIFVMCMTEKFWRAMAEEIGRPDLLQDSRFATMRLRTEHRAELTELLDAVFETRTMEHWVERLGGLIPIGPVYDVDRALDSPFVERIGMISDVPHPELPSMRLLSNPLRFNGERPTQKAGSALGADNDDILGS